MKRINFNANWMFYPIGAEAEKQTIHLPHDAMIQRNRIQRLKNGSFTGFFPCGDYIYLKNLFGDPAYVDQTVMLEFEGVYMDSIVFVNGEKIGGHVYGYSNFHVDLTGKLIIGQENEIRVEVHCSQVPNARWYPGNGIYRPIHLLVGNKEHVKPDGIFIRTLSHDPAMIEISVDADKDKDTSIETEIRYQGARVAACIGSINQLTVPNANLWSTETPNLYQAVVTLKKNGRVIDETTEVFGIRSLAWSAARGLEVNGINVKLKGGCVHHDYGMLGACDFQAAAYRRVRILKEAGYNAIRSAHNPISKQMLRACDELGMYVMDEAFDTWRDSNGLYGYTLYFEEEWRDDLGKMVLKDRNHPSVILYSIGNEISDTARPDGAELAGEMTSLCHSIDPSRPVTVCPNLFMNILSQKGVKLSLGSGNAPRKEDVTDPLSEDNETQMGGSAMINVLMATGPILMKLLLKPKPAERGSGHTFAKVDIAGYNYAEQVYEGHHRLAPDRIMVGSETHPGKIAGNWALVEKHPYLIGDFMWTAWDYLGEVGVGVIDYGKSSGAYIKPYPAVSAYTGAIDLTGHRDTNSHLAAIVWGAEVNPYIAVQQVNYFGEKKYLSHYRHTDALNSWSWPGCENRKTVVEIYSIGSKAELIQDGKSLGKKSLKGFFCQFSTIFKPGRLEAISYDKQGNEIGRSVLTSAGNDTVLSVNVENDEIEANGEDLSFINVEVTDKQGIVKMLSEKTIFVKVEGAGVLQSVGSANPRADEPYNGPTGTTFQGRLQIIVRSGTLPGDIHVTISADKLEDQRVTIHVVAS